MNSGQDTTGHHFHAADRRFLRWLRLAQPSELRAMRMSQDRTSCPNWERIAVQRAIEKRAVAK